MIPPFFSNSLDRLLVTGMAFSSLVRIFYLLPSRRAFSIMVKFYLWHSCKLANLAVQVFEYEINTNFKIENCETCTRVSWWYTALHNPAMILGGWVEMNYWRSY